MEVSAHQRVAELLKHPDDLVKTQMLRKRFEKEKASIDAKLKVGVEEQLDTIENGLDTLGTSRREMQAIREDLIDIDRLCSDAQKMVQDFPRINKISSVHRNFASTDDMVNNLRDMYARLDQIEKLLAKDSEDITGPAENLLALHFHVHKLQDFRDLTMFRAKSQSQDVRSTLESYFERLDKIIMHFEEYLWDLTKNLLDVIREENGSVVVKLVKIVEAEEKADEKSVAIQQARSNHKELASKFRSIQGNPRTLKHFRSKFLQAIEEGVGEIFDNCWESLKDDVPSILENLEWIFGDLALVDAELIPRFPRKYKIFDVYARAYHEGLYRLLQKFMEADPDAQTILRLLEWVKDYYKKMKKELQVPPELMEPKLLDGKEKELMDDYLKLIVKKMDEWMSNLMSTEAKEFIYREQPPETDNEDLFGMNGPAIMFQMINQQVDAAAATGQGAILASVVAEHKRVMNETQLTWSNLLSQELKRQIDKPDEVPGGLVEYTIAVANDQLRCADFLEQIIQRVTDMVSEKYSTGISENLNAALAGYLDTAQKGVQTLLSLIYNDLKQPFGNLFTNEWYKGSSAASTIMLQIVETYRDYVSDYQATLNVYLFDLLIEDMLDEFIVKYLQSMRAKNAKFKAPDYVKRMQEDVKVAFGFFVQYKTPEEMEDKFGILEGMINFITSKKSMIYLDYYSIRKVYWDVPLQFIEDVLKNRDDLDRSSVKEAMETIKTKSADMEAGTQPTLFSRLK